MCVGVHLCTCTLSFQVYMYVLRIGTQSLPGCVCVYICACKHRVYMFMCIFTYMSPRLDVGVYIGRVGTQSLYVGVCSCVYSHRVRMWV